MTPGVGSSRRRAWIVVSIFAATLWIGTAQPADAATGLTLSPATGTPGSLFTARMTFDGFDINCDSRGYRVRWDGVTLFGPSGPSSSVTLTVPSGSLGSPGSHTVAGDCASINPDTGANEFSAFATFVIPQPTTTTTKPTTTTTTRPKTTTTTTTTTLPGATTTTRPGQTTTTTRPGQTTTTTTTVPEEPTPSTDDTGRTTTTVTIPGGKGVRLDRASSPPGGAANANGEGCDRNADVALSIEDHQVGHTVSDERGRFLAPLELPNLPVGRYTLTAVCGPTLTTSLDIVLVSRVDTGSSTLAVLLFLLLLGGVMLRRLVAPDTLAR